MCCEGTCSTRCWGLVVDLAFTLEGNDAPEDEHIIQSLAKAMGVHKMYVMDVTVKLIGSDRRLGAARRQAATLSSFMVEAKVDFGETYDLDPTPEHARWATELAQSGIQSLADTLRNSWVCDGPCEVDTDSLTTRVFGPNRDEVSTSETPSTTGGSDGGDTTTTGGGGGTDDDSGGSTGTSGGTDDDSGDSTGTSGGTDDDRGGSTGTSGGSGDGTSTSSGGDTSSSSSGETEGGTSTSSGGSTGSGGDTSSEAGPTCTDGYRNGNEARSNT